MSIAQRYVDEIREGLKYWATWAPGTHLELGSCGPIHDSIFYREGNVADYGIEFDTLTSRTTQDWSFSSSGTVSWDVQAKADVQKISEVPQGQAGIQVKFSSENAVVLVAPAGTEASVKDVTALKQAVLRKAREHGSPGIYPADFAVITDLVTVDSATALISEGSSSEFVASAALDLAQGLVSLGDAKLGIAQKSAHGVKTLLVAHTDVTPLFRGFKLKPNWWTGLLKAVDLEGFAPADVDSLFEDLAPAPVVA